MPELEPPSNITKLERGIVFAMVALTVIGGWWKLNENKDKGRGR